LRSRDQPKLTHIFQNTAWDLASLSGEYDEPIGIAYLHPFTTNAAGFILLPSVGSCVTVTLTIIIGKSSGRSFSYLITVIFVLLLLIMS
jgi:hypothetical protein